MTNPDLDAIAQEVAANSVARVLRFIQYQFGAAGVQSLGVMGEEQIESLLFGIIMEGAVRVDAEHSRARLQESYAATMNVFRAAVAGGAAMKRDLTGEEPSDLERSLVMGSEVIE